VRPDREDNLYRLGAVCDTRIAGRYRKAEIIARLWKYTISWANARHDHLKRHVRHGNNPMIIKPVRSA
jgi:hypothetical protein